MAVLIGWAQPPPLRICAYPVYEGATHGRRINKNGKDESSLHFGLDVFCRFEARVGECYATYIPVPVDILGGEATLCRFIFCSEILMWPQWRILWNLSPGISIIRLRFEEIICFIHLSYFLKFSLPSFLLLPYTAYCHLSALWHFSLAENGQNFVKLSLFHRLLYMKIFLFIGQKLYKAFRNPMLPSASYCNSFPPSLPLPISGACFPPHPSRGTAVAVCVS